MPEVSYILQKINTNVFNSPFGIMHNIKAVTDHIRRQIIYQGLEPKNKVINIVNTLYDQVLCIRDDEYWRCVEYISPAYICDKISSSEMFYEMGRVIGEFQSLLTGFHTRVLDETIRHFHDTSYRYQKFLDVIKLDKYDRCKNVEEEISFFKERSEKYDIINGWIRDKIIPRRVCHNDTKPSNILIDSKTNKALCLIDLDTVMKGTLLFDYGDALRIGASTAVEDEIDLSKVTIDLNLFREFTKGFLTAVNDIITPNEVSGLVGGFHLITLEVAMRFLTDYLDGDNYFKIDYPDHNLIRARNQIKVVKEIENNRETLHDIIEEIVYEIGFDSSFDNLFDKFY